MRTPARRGSAVRPAVRVRLEHEGHPVFGPGPYELLLKVRDHGSLHKAAQEMGMAYSKAWRLIHDAEQHLGLVVLERKAGGASGGGSLLTADGEELLRRFGALQQDVRDELQRGFARYFTGDWWSDAPTAPHPDAVGSPSGDPRG